MLHSRNITRSGSYVRVGADHKTYQTYVFEFYTECYILKRYGRDKEEKQLDRFSIRNSTDVWKR